MLSQIEFLRHINDELDFVLKNSKDLEKKDFIEDEILERAFIRSLEVIGEAVKNLSSEFKNKHDSINWKEIAGLRDKLIHNYFGVDYDLVWDIIRNKIPEFRNKIKEIIKLEEDESN